MGDEIQKEQRSVIYVGNRTILRCAALLGLMLISGIAIMINPDAMNFKANTTGSILQIIRLIRSELRTVSLADVLAMSLLLFLYHRFLLNREKPFELAACILGCIFSIFMLLGLSFSTFHDSSFIFGCARQMVVACLVFMGYWIIFYCVLKILYGCLDRVRIYHYNYKGILNWIDQKFVLVCLATIILSWIVFAFPYFPGSVPHDGRRQLNMFFGYEGLNTHHPFFTTMILGCIYQLGSVLLGDGGGASLLIIMLQMIFGALVFSEISEYIRRKTNNLLAGLACMFYFSLSPVWWTFMQTVLKDAMYFISFAWFVLEYIKVFYGDGAKKDIAKLTVSSILICVFRNEGIVIALVSLLILMAITVHKRRMVGIVLMIVLCVFGVNRVLIDDVLKLKPRNQVEALSIPIQQIARYVTECGYELTKEEEKIIDCVVQYEGIPERYDPEKSDSIKDRYRNTTKEEWRGFWKLWFEKLKERPDIYVEATMNHVFGYTYPFYFYKGLSFYQLYSNGSINANDAHVQYSKYWGSNELRKFASEAAYIWQNIPLLSFVINPGFCTWIGIFLIGALARKKRWADMGIFVIPFICILICFASPVNGYLRYITPIMATMPLYILVGIRPHLNGSEGQLISENKVKIEL